MINNIFKTQKTSRAFVLLEFVLGIVILSVLSIALFNGFIALQQHALTKYQKTLMDINVNNALDIIVRHMNEENTFVFTDFTLILSSHIFSLRANTLFLDNIVLCDLVQDFEVKSIDAKSFSVRICYIESSKKLCLDRVGWFN